MPKIDPFLIETPFIVSFSGGRTSGLMLRRILDAHGGCLPDGAQVVFCNTGKERTETLDFVERCSIEWDCPITWLEYRWEPGRHYFVEVNYATASRNGEPFAMQIKSYNHLPSPFQRSCTGEMKIKTLNRYVRHGLGWDRYTNVVGLRSDEERRVKKLLRDPKETIDGLFGPIKISARGGDRAKYAPGESIAFPLYTSGVTLQDVLLFWQKSSFDLSLRPGEGNCDLCFLKGTAEIVRSIRSNPTLVDWWIAQEMQTEHTKRFGSKGRFRTDRPSYAELKSIAMGIQDEPGWLWADQGDSTGCGGIEECRCTD